MIDHEDILRAAIRGLEHQREQLAAGEKQVSEQIEKNQRIYQERVERMARAREVRAALRNGQLGRPGAQEAARANARDRRTPRAHRTRQGSAMRAGA